MGTANVTKAKGEISVCILQAQEEAAAGKILLHETSRHNFCLISTGGSRLESRYRRRDYLIVRTFSFQLNAAQRSFDHKHAMPLAQPCC